MIPQPPQIRRPPLRWRTSPRTAARPFVDLLNGPIKFRDGKILFTETGKIVMGDCTSAVCFGCAGRVPKSLVATVAGVDLATTCTDCAPFVSGESARIVSGTVNGTYNLARNDAAGGYCGWSANIDGIVQQRRAGTTCSGILVYEVTQFWIYVNHLSAGSPGFPGTPVATISKRGDTGGAAGESVLFNGTLAETDDCESGWVFSAENTVLNPCLNNYGFGGSPGANGTITITPVF
ncbi:hypothetical protein [Humisphaera borealis]|uniref:Uncharacterized protein n=1 Tax=Humisphaera borealis TaxID=2807512 RepID=A0A7M2X298_9BACT|nr:hypothetical protein [Humisphaera borealis]QOV90880.1 hypothetical protein IPV69_05840 [Humisphaera borealis]